jgi:ribonucleoside-diphosphate reductase alpha chain
MAGASGKKLHETYTLAWLRGLKTTYYLRTLGATSAEKSTTERIGQLNAVSADGTMPAGFAYGGSAPAEAGAGTGEDAPKFCALDDPTCEACQ